MEATIKHIEELMRKCREEEHHLTYADLLKLLQTAQTEAGRESKDDR